MPRIVRPNSGRRFAACFIVVFVMASVGLMIIVGITLTVLFVAGGSLSSGSSSAGSPGGADSTPGVGSTAPATGGWSSGG